MQAAMKLYKLKEKEKYFYWSITSNFLLAGGRPFVQDGEVQRYARHKHTHTKHARPHTQVLTGNDDDGNDDDMGGRLGKTVADGTAVQPATDARMLALSEMLLKKRFGAKAPAQLGVFLLYLSILTSQVRARVRVCCVGVCVLVRECVSACVRACDYVLWAERELNSSTCTTLAGEVQGSRGVSASR
jgi:hypothetical protein